MCVWFWKITALVRETAQLLKAAEEEEEEDEAHNRSATRAAPNSPAHKKTSFVVLCFPVPALPPNLIAFAPPLNRHSPTTTTSVIQVPFSQFFARGSVPIKLS